MADLAHALAARLKGARRILILGSPGSGKSQLAAALALALDLPLIHIDDLYWQRGWQRPHASAFRERLVQVLSGASWILDGNYEDSLELRWRHADAAVFLEVPAWRCLCRSARRGWQRRFGNAESLPAAVRADPRRWTRPDPRFVWKIATFRRRIQPRVFAALGRDADAREVVVVRNGSLET